MKNSVLIGSLAAVLLMLPSSVSARGNSCWGEATSILARTGEMGAYASEQDEPRLGLANLALAIFEAGVVDELTLESLAGFVAAELGLDLNRCLEDPEAVQEAEATAAQNAACCGQATAVFAQTGQMGIHAGEQDEPRMGLANLARALFEAGILEDDSLAALGAFVAAEPGLDIEACQ